MKDLINWLNERTKEYDAGHPTVSDKEYDDKYFELICMEKESGIIYPDSPTQKIDYRIVNKLNKVEHNHKMLSLNKTKDVEVIKSFLGDKEYCAMLKMDGLTCSLRYFNGKLVSAETRGNGLIGEDILHNAKVIPSIPNTIAYKDELVVDGEIICTYKDFEEFSELYANPRNFAAGSIRLLDAKECETRKLTFVAWEIIKGFEETTILTKRLILLNKLGFTTVPTMSSSSAEHTSDIISALTSIAKTMSYPIDGIVFKFNDCAYGHSLGETAHHFKNAIAFKFYDELYETELKNIEWSLGRTGVLTPIAIFNPVDDGESVIERASLHNVSVMYETLGEFPYIGQKIKVGKSNQIIPQIYEADKDTVVYIEDLKLHDIPTVCPICGKIVKINDNDGIKTLVCDNPNCEGKILNIIDHFCSKKGLDIKGLSKATIEKLLDWGWLENISDVMSLSSHKAEWIKKPGFGPKSVDNILNAIEAAKTTTLDKFISSLGIPMIGETVAKELVKYISTYEDFRDKVDNHFNFGKYDGFAENKTFAIWNYDYTEADKVFKYLTIKVEEETETNTETSLNGMKFVITGRLNKYTRNQIKELIEQNGGKTVESVSKNVNYLINNDITSTSSKNLSAKKLSIPILSEEDFENLFLKK